MDLKNKISIGINVYAFIMLITGMFLIYINRARPLTMSTETALWNHFTAYFYIMISAGLFTRFIWGRVFFLTFVSIMLINVVTLKALIQKVANNYQITGDILTFVISIFAVFVPYVVTISGIIFFTRTCEPDWRAYRL